MKVYHIELKNQPEPYKHQYFGSKASIYEWLTPEDIGITYKTLRAKGDLTNRPYENGKCIIRQGELRRKESNRCKASRYAL